MESLLASRKTLGQRTQLENLSPEKYGRAAFSSLSYTPSKLVDNVLYKDFSNQKKLEEGSSKLRQTEASNSILQDRLAELQQEKQGVEKALSDQISMYKKILKEKQDKNEKRIKTMQQNFNTEMSRLIAEKQQQAKYAQAQKQLLQNRIFELQQIVEDYKNRLQSVSNDHSTMVSENEKLKLVQQSLTKRLEDSENAFTRYDSKCKEQIQQLRNTIQENELQWQRRLDREIQTKQREIENLQRLHRNQLQKIQNKRAQQTLLKNQQLKDLASTFEKQTVRLNGIISKKQDQITELGRVIETQKQKTFHMSKNYENEITNLSHEKSRLKEQLLKGDMQMEKLVGENKQLEQRLRLQTQTLQQQVKQLKKDLQLNQINLMMQIDKNSTTMDDLSREMIRLRLQNEQLSKLMDENSQYIRQLRNMKQLLIQSSIEMEKCKQEFIRIGREKDFLAVRLRELGIQNQTLYRIKNQREEEARGWRESYFTQKAAHY